MAWQPDYVTVSEMREYLRISDTDDDVPIAMAISAASRAIDQHAGRQFGQVDAAEERVYTARWDRRRCRWVIAVDDLMDDTDLELWTDAGQVDTVALEPRNAAARSLPWTRITADPDSDTLPTGTVDGVTITALWGWDSVPTPVKQATMLQASRFLARRDSPYGIAGSPDVGSEMRLLARVDPDVAVVLRPYVRVWAAV